MHEINNVSRILTHKLSALDLRAEAEEHGGRAYRIQVNESPTPVEVLVVGTRAGVAWGADAVWTDVPDGAAVDAESAIIATKRVLNGQVAS